MSRYSSNLKFDLIQRGFNPSTADECVTSFRDSVNYARFYDQAKSAATEPEEPFGTEIIESDSRSNVHTQQIASNAQTTTMRMSVDTKSDQIPIRLPGGRRAWLVVPTPFYESDKKRIVAHLDLLLTDVEETSTKKSPRQARADLLRTGLLEMRPKDY